MKHFRWMGATALIAGLIAACTQESATPQSQSTPTEAGSETASAQSNITDDDSVAVATERSIDWQAAREALGGGAEEGMVQVQSANPAPVPVLLPSGIVMPANATPSYRTLEDGYFAFYPGDRFDIVVNGTLEAFQTEGRDPADRPDMVFTETDSGASMALSRFGADYLVEFECRVIEPDGGCISEEEAIEIIDKLIVVGTQ